MYRARGAVSRAVAPSSRSPAAGVGARSRVRFIGDLVISISPFQHHRCGSLSCVQAGRLTAGTAASLAGASYGHPEEGSASGVRQTTLSEDRHQTKSLAIGAGDYRKFGVELPGPPQHEQASANTTVLLRRRFPAPGPLR